MAPNPSFLGYSNNEYLDDPYMGDEGYHSFGVQANLVIESSQSKGIQSNRVIDSADYFGVQSNRAPAVEESYGVQANLVIASADFYGVQTNLIVGSSDSFGVQFLGNITQPHPSGVQFEGSILDYPSARAIEVRRSKSWPHVQCEDAGYLATPYLSDPYMVPGYCVHGPTQANRVISFSQPYGVQAQLVITDDKSHGVQSLRTIANFPHPIGVQVDLIRSVAFGIQARFVLYNTTNLRVLCDFPSRGAAGAGLNAWGNPKGTGQNWSASDTDAGDFDVSNLNTDIVEQRWQTSAAVTSAILSCDTETTQGTSIDTLALLSHNLTTSANVTVEGSVNASFSPVGYTFAVEPTRGDAIYIAPTFPVQQFRYWRIVISDPTNPNGRIYIGTVLFGTTVILQGECFVDEVTRGLRHFADKVQTAGFTNVSNDRALKRAVSIEFRMMKYRKGNYKNLRAIFEYARTSLKCLWVPDPQQVDRFTLFAKMPSLPAERHKNMGTEDSDLVDFLIDLDESL